MFEVKLSCMISWNEGKERMKNGNELCDIALFWEVIWYLILVILYKFFKLNYLKSNDGKCDKKGRNKSFNGRHERKTPKDTILCLVLCDSSWEIDQI